MRGNEIRHSLLKQFYAISLDTKTIKHPCFSPCTQRNKDMFERRSVEFKTISVPSTCPYSNIIHVVIVTSRSWMALWHYCWGRKWLGVRFMPRMSASIHAVFCLNYSMAHVYKRDQEWLPVHGGDQRHLGFCLGYVPALAYGSCRVSHQGTTMRASGLHNAWATILNPFGNTSE